MPNNERFGRGKMRSNWFLIVWKGQNTEREKERKRETDRKTNKKKLSQTTF